MLWALLVKREGVFELLSQVLVDRLAALKDRSSVFEAFYLFHDEANGVDFVLFAAIDRDDALSIFFGFIRKNLDHGSSGPFYDISDHVAL